MSNKEVFNYFSIDYFPEKPHQVYGVGLLDQLNFSFHFMFLDSVSQATKNDWFYTRPRSPPKFLSAIFPLFAFSYFHLTICE